MHPQLGYQFALDRGRELQRAAEADRLARSVRGTGRRGRSGANRVRPADAVAVPAVAFPGTLGAVLDEVGMVVDELGERAVFDDAAPVVQDLVELILRAAKEAGVADLPIGPRPDEPTVVGYRTLACIGTKIATSPDIVLLRGEARQIGFAIANLRALGARPGEHARLDQGRRPAIARRLAAARIFQFGPIGARRRIRGSRVTAGGAGAGQAIPETVGVGEGVCGLQACS